MKINFEIVLEYVIRHLKLNRFCTKRIDKLLKDSNETVIDNAIDELKKFYTPPSFECTGNVVNISHEVQLQIIIPVYNDEKYIEDCLYSILNQHTGISYCVVVVDDGSTDDTQEIVKQIANEDTRVKYMSIPHGGTALARNEALKSICADYIMFVDGDDFLKQGAIDTLMTNAYANDADVVEGGYEAFSTKVHGEYLHRPECLYAPIASLWGFSCVKVIRADLFYDLCFPNSYWYEDTIIFYLLYTRCGKIQTVEDVVYAYRDNKNGMSHHRGSEVKYLDAFWVLNYTIREMVNRNILITQEIYEQFLKSVLTAGKRMLCIDKRIHRLVLASWSNLFIEFCSQYRTKSEELTCFEKAILNNDFRKYQLFLVSLR